MKDSKDVDKIRFLLSDPKEHAEKARVFFPGCPHCPASVTLSATIRALVEKHKVPDWSFLPYHLRPIYRKGDFLFPEG